MAIFGLGANGRPIRVSFYGGANVHNLIKNIVKPLDRRGSYETIVAGNDLSIFRILIIRGASAYLGEHAALPLVRRGVSLYCLS